MRNSERGKISLLRRPKRKTYLLSGVGAGEIIENHVHLSREQIHEVEVYGDSTIKAKPAFSLNDQDLQILAQATNLDALVE